MLHGFIDNVLVRIHFIIVMIRWTGLALWDVVPARLVRQPRQLVEWERTEAPPLLQCLGFGVWGLGFGVWGLGFGVWGLGFRASGFGFRASGFGFRVSGFGFRVSGFGFRVSGRV